MSVLITGASGLIGTHLTKALLQKGYSVSHLGREKKSVPNVKSFVWDIDKGYLEPGALEGVTTIIHLAGAGVAEKRWTPERKRELLLSRTLSTRLLYEALKKGDHQVKQFIAASGIAYYGVSSNVRPWNEDDPEGEDFLANLTKQWEAEVDRVGTLIRVCKLRTGIVLSKTGGALPKLAAPVKLFVGAPLGSGEQSMNWIHIDDQIGLYIHMMENESLHGVFNAVGPAPVSNRVFTKAVARVLKRPILAPAVPAFVMKLLLGEMAYIILEGGDVSADKVIRANYKFKFTNLEEALRDQLQ